MNYRIKVKDLYYLGLIMCFFPCFALFFIPKSSINMLVCNIFWILIPTLLFVINRQRFLSFVVKIFKLRIMKIYSLFLIYITLNTIVHFILGYNKAEWYGNIFYFILFYSTLILLFLYPLWGLYLKIKFKSLIRIFYIMIFITLLAGFIEWFGINYNISIITNIIDFFTNTRYGYKELDNSFYLRAHSLYNEPSSFASFIFTVFPFIINLYWIKNKLFSNKWLNSIFKLFLLPLAICTLFMTESPTYILFTIIELIVLICIHFKNKILRLQNILVILTIFLLLPILISDEKISYINNTTIMKRVYHTIESITNMNRLNFVEESLATRIQSGIIHWNIFKNNPVFGVGINTSDSYSNNIFFKINIALTTEMYKNYNSNLYPHLNSTILWKLLAEIGIIGVILYYWFYFTCLKLIYKIKKYYCGIEYQFIDGMLSSFIATLVISVIYCGMMEKIIYWLLYGFVLLLYYKLIYYRFYKK